MSNARSQLRQSGRIVLISKRRVFLISGSLGLALASGVTTAQATKPAPTHEVTLCHRTGSADGGNQHNGYDLITVDIASVADAMDAGGHDSHDQIGNGPGGDIIPSYTYLKFTYPGKDLGGGGESFLENGCKSPTPPDPSTTTTTPPDPSTTTTPPEVLAVVATLLPAHARVLAVMAAAPQVAPAVAANPLPTAAAAGEVDTSGQLVAAGSTGFGAFLALGAGFVLRRRHGVS